MTAGTGVNWAAMVRAVDACGYDYVGGEPFKMLSTLHPFTLAYFEDDGPNGHELPKLKTATEPSLVNQEMLAAESATCPGHFSPFYLTDFSNAVKAQMYLATFTVRPLECPRGPPPHHPPVLPFGDVAPARAGGFPALTHSYVSVCLAYAYSAGVTRSRAGGSKN